MLVLPEEVAGVRWRRGRPGDVDVVAAVVVAADRADDPGNIRTHADIAEVLDGLGLADAAVVGEIDGVPVAVGARFTWAAVLRLLGAVVPSHRGIGIGRALLAAQVADALATDADAEVMGLRAVGDGGVARLAARAGFRPSGVFVTMRRRIADPVPHAALPPGLTAVPFDESLDEPLRRVKHVVFQDHWQNEEDDPDQWRARVLGDRLARDRSRIALDADGAIAGFVVIWIEEERAGEAYVPLVGTAAAWRGRGVARALLASAIEALQGTSLEDLVLDVDSENGSGAGGVYRSVGFVETERATFWTRPLPGRPIG